MSKEHIQRESDTDRPLHPSSIEAIRMRLHRIGRADLLDHFLMVQRIYSLPMSMVCLFIDDYAEALRRIEESGLPYTINEMYGIMLAERYPKNTSNISG